MNVTIPIWQKRARDLVIVFFHGGIPTMENVQPDFQQILQNPDLVWQEGFNYFQGHGMLQTALSQLIADLERHGIDYNLIGAAALSRHGYQRFTIDIDLLLTSDGLQKFHDELVGPGYRPAFEGARKKFRSTTANVPIDIIVAGEYPGDGQPKPVRFHDPRENFVIINGVKTVNLETLINLKLASGLSGAGRLKDLADVEELIRHRQLDESYAAGLDPSVREKFLELARGVAVARALDSPER
ncbi:MAG: nucleotidyl transferase AbiEii/AbiGii toxin family protein [Blastocatellia bacterium]